MTTNQPSPVEPAELTDQELLRTYNEELVQTYNARNYINEERVRAATIAGLRAVIAADRAGRPAPPAEGEVGELVDFLEKLGSDYDGPSPPQESITLFRAADLLQQQAAELAMLRQLARPVAIPGEAYHDGRGPVTWWRFPVEEAPWVGTPNDSDWPGYHTHFTPCPAEPVLPLPSGEEVA